MKKILFLAFGLLATACLLNSCTQEAPEPAPIFYTPFHGKVDLANVTMGTTDAKITRKGNKYTISFDFHILNKSGKSIAFACLQNHLRQLIEVNVYDAEGTAIPLVRDPLDDLTRSRPKSMLIPAGLYNGSYQHLITHIGTEDGAPVTIRARLHTPSRYDELRTTLEAPLVQTLWPEGIPTPQAPAEE